jgi:RES domain-containing protein
MLVFRIVLAKYANGLRASGRAARWNNNDTEMIYCSSSQSLACLENVVHRSQLGLSSQFKVLIIEIPDDLNFLEIGRTQLSEKWTDFENMYLTQNIGDKWIKEQKSAILRVPSSIVQSEYNYLLNPNHANFKQVKLKAIEPFVFDDRIKR